MQNQPRLQHLHLPHDLGVWVTYMWKQLEMFFLFAMGHQGHGTYAGLLTFALGNEMGKDVTDECHRGSAIQLGTI